MYDHEDRTFNNAMLAGLNVGQTIARNPPGACTVQGYNGVRRRRRNTFVKISFNSATLVAFGMNRVYVNGRIPR